MPSNNERRKDLIGRIERDFGDLKTFIDNLRNKIKDPKRSIKSLNRNQNIQSEKALKQGDKIN